MEKKTNIITERSTNNWHTKQLDYIRYSLFTQLLSSINRTDSKTHVILLINNFFRERDRERELEGT